MFAWASAAHEVFWLVEAAQAGGGERAAWRDVRKSGIGGLQSEPAEWRQAGAASVQRSKLKRSRRYSTKAQERSECVTESSSTPGAVE